MVQTLAATGWLASPLENAVLQAIAWIRLVLMKAKSSSESYFPRKTMLVTVNIGNIR